MLGAIETAWREEVRLHVVLYPAIAALKSFQ